jgi:hypothetical protein
MKRTIKLIAYFILVIILGLTLVSNAQTTLINTPTGLIINRGNQCVDSTLTVKGRTILQPRSLTGSAATSALSLTQTWNTSGAPSLIFANVTQTAAGGGSNLIQLQTNSLDRFVVRSNGSIIMGTSTDFTITGGSGAAFRYSACIGSLSNAVASAILECTSTTRGFLPPRMTTTQKNAISSPAAGLMVYDTTLNQMSYYNGTTWINF